jgi:peroxiredoxin
MQRLLSILTSFCALSVLGSFCVAVEPRVAKEAGQTEPLKSGVKIPEVAVKNPIGDTVELSSLHKERPVVLVFFRGGWCPICTRHTGDLIKIYPQVKELGAELVGISPDDIAHSQENVADNSIPFQILSDADVTAAKAFGLAFQVDDETLKKYKGFGIDLVKASGFDHHVLPVPAVYIVDQSGKIVFAHSDPDYRERLDTSRIISELKKMK